MADPTDPIDVALAEVGVAGHTYHDANVKFIHAQTDAQAAFLVLFTAKQAFQEKEDAYHALLAADAANKLAEAGVGINKSTPPR